MTKRSRSLKNVWPRRFISRSAVIRARCGNGDRPAMRLIKHLASGGKDTGLPLRFVSQNPPAANFLDIADGPLYSLAMITIDLSGKTAVVTGGGQGLGLATARRLHDAGANVAISYFVDRAGVNEQRARESTDAIGERSVAVEGDVRDRPSLQAMFDSIHQQFGSIDIVINNAGIIRDRSFKNMEDSEWEAVIQTNLTGVYNVCKEAAPRLADGGRIVNLASISGFVGFFGQANYSAAKAGVVGLTKVLSKELAGRQINVNAVAPGVVMTEMAESIPDQARDQMLQLIPLGRFG